MPVLKIPIVHKFGIISHSQRLELQERLLRQNYEKEKASTKTSKNSFNPLEVCEKFVRKYNNGTMNERDTYQAEAHRLLTHCKRRAGITNQGEGPRVDLPMAWSELAILAQCKGKLQEDCLDILCKSLNHAPVHEENIATLFFLAESVLYWLRTDSVNSRHLRTAEIRLLKLGFLVFVRLYYHHLSNNLTGLSEFKMRLCTYLEGVKEHEDLYKSYPSVLLSLRFITKVGEIITAVDSHTTQNEISSKVNIPQQKLPQMPLKPVIYRALQVWHCKDKKVGLKQALLDIMLSAKELSTENWIDSLFALSIFGDAAKTNFTICQTLQDVSRGVDVSLNEVFTPRTAGALSSPRRKLPRNDTLGETGEKKETRGEVFQKIMNGMIADLDSAIGNRPVSSTNNESPVRVDRIGQENPVKNSEIPESSTNLKIDVTTQPGNSRRPTPAASSRLRSGRTNPNTPDTVMGERIITTGITSWSWEVAFQYSQILTDICLRGGNAVIQKSAMLGKWLGADVTTFRAGAPNHCIDSCGLVDLLEYRNSKEIHPSNQLTSDDSSWCVRYGALSGLLHITHALKEDTLKEGMRSAAWSLIVAIQNSPVSEDRVLEALRAGQVEYPSYYKTNGDNTLNIWSRVSRALIEHFLVAVMPFPTAPSSLTQPAPLAPPGSRQSVSRSHNSKKQTLPVPTKSTQSSPKKSCPNRTTLNEHLAVTTNVDTLTFDYHMRNSLNLGRVVEDQWRKQMMIEHEREEEVRLRELQEKQKEEEQRLAEVIERRKEKLKGKPTQTLGPYQIPQ